LEKALNFEDIMKNALALKNLVQRLKPDAKRKRVRTPAIAVKLVGRHTAIFFQLLKRSNTLEL
jgi:hypothetical protein